jgi:transcriptional regulator with XRE-family HTH domain
MASRESAAAMGERRSRLLRIRTGDELASTRRALGLSHREIARRIGIGPQRIARAERGEPAALTIDVAARIAPVLGLQLAVSLHPNGDRVRDRGHLALLARLRARIPNAPGWRIEVPVPIAGDPRSGDAMVTVESGDILIEAETHLGDIQSLERRCAAKARDLGASRLVLLVADTRHNRQVIRDHRELLERFPIGTRACLARLANGHDPGGDALVIL